ncbi:hypothetical protein B0T19DRAFT_414375 [Cercophora scortea]|uniref:Uncharacterized protein n=1 Tax=Cercophora scortea TaxID=314031 RepID=A0AAE0MGS2_9PEZI|nr:hypothetical protein B0T19DRAFT_414375 [Cercophora scortea]
MAWCRVHRPWSSQGSVDGTSVAKLHRAVCTNSASPSVFAEQNETISRPFDSSSGSDGLEASGLVSRTDPTHPKKRWRSPGGRGIKKMGKDGRDGEMKGWRGCSLLGRGWLLAVVGYQHAPAPTALHRGTDERVGMLAPYRGTMDYLTSDACCGLRQWRWIPYCACVCSVGTEAIVSPRVTSNRSTKKEGEVRKKVFLTKAPFGLRRRGDPAELGPIPSQ